MGVSIVATGADRRCGRCRETKAAREFLWTADWTDRRCRACWRAIVRGFRAERNRRRRAARHEIRAEPPMTDKWPESIRRNPEANE